MTDPGTADRTYIGPMSPELVEEIIEKVSVRQLLRCRSKCHHTSMGYLPNQPVLAMLGIVGAARCCLANNGWPNLAESSQSPLRGDCTCIAHATLAALHIQRCLCVSQVLDLSALKHSPQATQLTLATNEQHTVCMPAELGLLVMLVAVGLRVHKLQQ